MQRLDQLSRMANATQQIWFQLRFFSTAFNKFTQPACRGGNAEDKRDFLWMNFPLTPRRGLDLRFSFVYFFLVANLMHTIAVDITNMHSVWGPCEQKFWNNLAAICLSKSLYSQIVVWWDQQHLRRVIFRSSYAWLARGWKNTCWQPGGMFTA